MVVVVVVVVGCLGWGNRGCFEGIQLENLLRVASSACLEVKRAQRIRSLHWNTKQNLRMRTTPPDLYFRFVIISCVSWEISRSMGGSSLQEAPGLLCPRRSQEVRGSLQPKSLRALEEAWMASFGLSSLVFFCASLGA